MVSAVDYSDYMGRLAIGRLARGKMRVNQEVVVCNAHDDKVYKAKISNIYQFEGLKSGGRKRRNGRYRKLQRNRKYYDRRNGVQQTGLSP